MKEYKLNDIVYVIHNAEVLIAKIKAIQGDDIDVITYVQKSIVLTFNKTDIFLTFKEVDDYFQKYYPAACIDENKLMNMAHFLDYN